MNKAKQFSISLSTDHRELLERLKQQKGYSFTMIVRIALEQYFDKIYGGK